MTTKILRIDASARRIRSVSRSLIDQIVERYKAAGPAEITTRDLTTPLPQITEDWVDANFAPKEDRTAEQKEVLRLSDQLVSELRDSHVILIGLPIYNFGVPASLKAWIDQISRVGETFRYTESGPKGLLIGKRAIVAVASGGTKMGSEIDFATGYLRHMLGFVGITDVTFVVADQLALDADASLSAAQASLEALPLAA